jgi:predicted GNAT family N-acyltransferase
MNETISFRQIEFDSKKYHQMVALRYEELREPLGLQFSQNDLLIDAKDFLLGGFIHEEIICCCILSHLTSNTFKLRQMAVRSDFQNKNMGRQMLLFAENFSVSKNIYYIEMNARLQAKPFYEKCGYNSIGEIFIEVNIPHLKMVKHLKNTTDIKL